MIMNIDISAIAKLNNGSMDIALESRPEALERISEHFSFPHPLLFNGLLTKTGSIITLSGTLQLQYTAHCYRCLDDASGLLTVPVTETFVPKETVTADSESYAYTGNFLSLEKPLLDNIILHLPMKTVCKPDCKGLCPSCGHHLDSGKCLCDEQPINPKMAGLKDFFNK